MNHLLNITRKELKELLTPSTVLTVLVVLVMFAGLGMVFSQQAEDVTTPSPLLVVNEDTSLSGITDPEGYQDAVAVINMLYGVQYDLDPSQVPSYVTVHTGAMSDGDLFALMNEVGAGSVIIIKDGFASCIENMDANNPAVLDTKFIYESKGVFGSVSSMVAYNISNAVNQYISSQLVLTETSNPFVLAPVSAANHYTYFNGNFVEGVMPAEIDNALMNQSMIIPIIIMVIIMMIGSIVISSMGNEKENKTLETLLTMPVKRTTIVTGKLLAASITGLLFGAAYMVGMMFYMNGVTSGLSSSVDLNALGLTLDAVDWAIILLQMFLTILAALGICMILGAFVKNYKSAQTMTLPISVLAMIPMFVIMFMGWETLPTLGKVLLFVIPFTHPMMIMNNLMFGNMALVLGGLVYNAAFMLVVIYITVRLYKSDILITGLSQNKYVVRMRNMFLGGRQSEE